MTQQNRKISTSMFLVALMLFAPLAASSTVTTFANGDSEVDIELRDGSVYLNLVDGLVDIPAGETVTGASLKIATNILEHSSQARIDIDTMPRVWNPAYNNQLTIFSNIDDFQIEDGSQATPVSLKSDGFLTDFEGTEGGFMDVTNPLPPTGVGWEHGSLFGGTVINSNCASGADCWGTNIYDDDYTDDNGAQAFELSLNSAEMFVSPQLKSHTAQFSSWHNLESFGTSGTNPQTRYTDCAYVEIRSSLVAGQYDPMSSAGFDYIPIDIQSSTGIGMGNGYYSKSTGTTNNQITSHCGGIPNTTPVSAGIGGMSTTLTNPTGWADVALDLSGYVGKYIQLRFVMEHQGYNPPAGYSVQDFNTSGWYIDNFRLGDLLPQSGEMTIRGFLPSTLGGENHPNGFGILNLESEITTSATIEVDVIDSTNGQIVIDNNGAAMSGLSGKIIELWDVNSTTYPSINLKFRFDSGPSRLSTPVLHGLGMGTRIGNGFNQSSGGMNTIVNGVWESPGMGEPMMYSASILDTSFTVALDRQKFNRPITSITPFIQDDCLEDPAIDVFYTGVAGAATLSNNVTTNMAEPVFGFKAVLSYATACNIGGMWFDLAFGHHAERIQIDVAHDGDIDWGFDEPAFGSFGRQTTLWNNKADGINYGAQNKVMTADLSGTAIGGHFMLPKGSVVTAADVAFDDITIHSNSDPIEGFDLYLVSGSQEYSLGSIDNTSIVIAEGLPTPLGLSDALNSLLTNPMVPHSHDDAYGNKWMTFFFKATSPNASTGTSMTVKGLDIIYDYSTVINNGDGLDSELNQGVALWDGGGATASVPIAVISTTGGGVTLSNLSLSTSTGYDNTIAMSGNPVGLYPNGDIYEIVTTHTVDPLTGSSLAEATLSFESNTGNAILSYSDFLGFSEASDEDNLITLESSTYTDITNGKEVTWRFRVNPTWEDTATVRIYSGLIAGNGVNGLPDALLMAPVGGNAVENDAGLTSFSLQNSIGTIQDLDDGMSNQEIILVGSIRLQDLDASPDPTSYYMVLQLRHVNNTEGVVTTEWEEVANQSGVIGGDFNWNIDLGSTAAGEETYRFKIDGYQGGDTLCPSLSLRPDADCAIPFNLTIDTYDPNLINLQVLNGQVDENVDSNWRTLVDDTWVVPSANQKIRMQAQDLPNPPATLELYIWVQHDHDEDEDGFASADEYISITLTSDGEVPTSNYSGEYNDYANEGQDPVGKVSLWIEGFDLAGNPIDGGAPGFDNDHVTYVSMSSKNPVIRNFFIEDSRDNRFIKSSQQQWQGSWNQTLYAGNEYHLIVEAGDDNGWRDVEYIRIDLDSSREDMTLWYFPRNETAWTDSQWIDVIAESEDNPGARLLRMDGGHLVDTFESDFYLDLPIRIDWGVTDLGLLNIPDLYMQDLDNPRYKLIQAPGRHIQDWYYSDGIQLDFRTDETNDLMVTPVFADESEPFTSDIRKGFVYPGDIVSFAGQYAYRDGIYDSVYIKPEIEMTLKVTREDAVMNGAKGYIAYPGETFYHNFTGGEFNINITAPPVTNDYRYTFELVDLPNGAIDTTYGICSSTSSFGCASFNIKVDSNSPRVATNSWTAKKGATGEILEGFISTANYHCIDVEVIIEEQEALFPGDVQVAWKFFDDPANDIAWGSYRSTHGSDPMTANLDLLPTGGSYFATGNCIDLWPLEEGQFDPSPEDISGVEVIFWIEGVDSAGSQIILGGGLQEDGSVGHMVSGELSHKSIYNFIHEEAKFDVLNVKMNPSNPTVGQKLTLEVELRNTGTMAGKASLIVKSVINDGIPSKVGTIETDEMAIGQSAWYTIELEAFPSATTGMYYMIIDNSSSDLKYDGSLVGDQFNVKVQEESDGGGMALLLAIVGIIAAVLAVLVVVLFKRGQDNDNSSNLFGDGEYEDEGEGKVYAELPTHASHPSDIDPEMARAIATFPQWNQAEIQGYFDQGWSIEALQDWVKGQ